MRVGVLFSGGKDSCLALIKAIGKNTIKCLINVCSENPESYMFHTINSDFTRLQAKAMKIPLERIRTKGLEEKEVYDLKLGLLKIKKKYKLEGIVSGAIASNYQYSRINKVCEELRLKSITPLWQKPQEIVLKDVLKNKIKAIIVGVFADNLNKDFLGKEIDYAFIRKMQELNKRTGLNISGEGGEFETFVIDAPVFKRRIVIQDFIIDYKNNSGVMKIRTAKLERKLKTKSK
ncbi:MAG: diphthine--ammonia ligase [Candidatus Woesearchaeota archaeon]